jgi:hypothetical protein
MVSTYTTDFPGDILPSIVPATAPAATAVTSNRVIRKLRVMNIPFMGLCFLGLKPLVHEFPNSNEINREEALRYMRQWKKPFASELL